MAAAPLSIPQQFQGQTVLITGATGYIGGLLVESLLRTTDVAKIVLLLRPKHHVPAQERCRQLLQTNIFHKVRNNPQLLGKVEAVEGDIEQPGLGLSAADSQRLQQTVSIILHAAADIRLESDIQTSLTANVLGTQVLLALAAGCSLLRCFLHVSSCFVNMHQPAGSVVGERLYPLDSRSQLDAQQFVTELMSLPRDSANTRATALGQRWHFPNNYTLSKHLAEQLVCRASSSLPIAIVRPSLVCAIAYEPIPGYIGNYAGPIGASAALALGFYHSLQCVSSHPLHCWDIVPGDMAANAVLAAAAAVAAASDGDAAVALAARQAAAGASGGELPPLLIVQAASSSTYPLTLLEGWNYAVEFIRAFPPRFRLCAGPPPAMKADFRPDPAAVRRQRRWIGFKVALACWLLRLFGQGRAAARLRSGFEALCVYGTSKTDKDLTFSSAALQALEAALQAAGQQQQYPLVMRPGLALPGGGGGISSSSSSAQEAQPQTLTWRRFFHSQLAAVYSLLLKAKVPPIAVGSDGTTALEHDFVFVR